ncbi:hypothetical protein MPER_11994 [Moniliophthora perniciosa FA553]|nr:hypothetical protein MPER_11994 [Moniliophthora perniciosa FA553]
MVTSRKSMEASGTPGEMLGEIERPSSEKGIETPVEFDYPDGGPRACAGCTRDGMLRASIARRVEKDVQVFQSYYEETLLSGYSPSSIAWIGSIQALNQNPQYALVFFPALPIGRLFDLGYFKGVLTGIACGCVFGPTVGVIGHWFKRRRGLAMGLMAVGSSIGGTVFPIATRQLIGKVGFPWTMRILGFVLLFALAIPNLTLARRLPPKNVKGGLFNWSLFKSAPFTVYTMGAFFTYLGLYTVLTYIDVAALSVGVSPDLSFYLLSIANASSGLGRLTAALLTDKIGPLNFIAPTTFLAGILTYAWPFAHSLGPLIVVAIIYGYITFPIFVWKPTSPSSTLPLFEMGEIQDIGRRAGMFMSVGAIGALVGPPISGAINHATGGYEKVAYYAGSMVVLSVVLM